MLFNLFSILSVVSIHVFSLDLSNYDRNKAKEILRQEFLKEKLWSFPSNKRGYSYFSSLNDFRRNGDLEVIPVIEIVVDNSKEFIVDFKYSKFCGVVTKNKQLIDLIIINYYYDKDEKLIPVTSTLDMPKQFYNKIKKRISFVFYDIGKGSFGYCESNSLFFWDNHKKGFIRLS